MTEDGNLQSILESLLKLVEDWSVILVVLGVVVGMVVATRSAIALYNAAQSEQNMYSGGNTSGQIGNALAGIILGSLMTVFSLVMAVVSGWFVGT